MKPLDPGSLQDKGHVKAHIVDTLANEFADADRLEIMRHVEREYERLLAGARVVEHIPSLTAGAVRRSLHRQRAGAAAQRNATGAAA